MAVRPISITGDPVLHSPASEVTVVDDELRALVADMFETMDAAPGVGLAGPQVGVGKRLFVYSWTDDDGTLWRGVAVNPTLWQSPLSIEPLDDESESEGCLSVPGFWFPTPRWSYARVEGVDLDGAPVVLEGTGLMAQALQHETDHLAGTLYVMTLEGETRREALREIRSSDWWRA